MPVEYLRENPTTGTGVYYPACGPDGLYAYHGIAARVRPEDFNPRLIAEPQELIATENAFRLIWQQGAVYSATERRRIGLGGQSSMIFGMDRAAGDDDFVFLNVCKPHSAGRLGYHLVFDPYKLVEEGALVGLDDLQGLYMTVADRLRIDDRNDERTWTPEQLEAFLDDARFIQDVWRLSGGEALDWLEWIQGLRDVSPVNAAALRYVSRQVGERSYHQIRWLAENVTSAVGNAEVLMPEVLPLDWLVGVIFRKDWIEIDDFVEVYGEPGTEPPEALEFHHAYWVSGRTGHPARCVECGGYMGLAPMELPESTSSYGAPCVYHDRMKGKWIERPTTVLACRTCGAAYEMGGKFDTEPFKAEKFIAPLEELEFDSGW